MRKQFVNELSEYLNKLMVKGVICSYQFEETKEKMLQLKIYNEGEIIFNYVYLMVDKISENFLCYYVSSHKDLINDNLISQSIII